MLRLTDHRVGLKIQRPPRAPLGRIGAPVATSNAVSLPDSLRSASGRAASLSARSMLPSTKRHLVR